MTQRRDVLYPSTRDHSSDRLARLSPCLEESWRRLDKGPKRYGLSGVAAALAPAYVRSSLSGVEEIPKPRRLATDFITRFV